MEDPIHLRILSPAGTLLDKRVSYVRIPTPGGSVGVLKNHAPMLCAVGEGSLVCRFEGDRELHASLSGGVARVENNTLTVLAEEALIEE